MAHKSVKNPVPRGTQMPILPKKDLFGEGPVANTFDWLAEGVDGKLDSPNMPLEELLASPPMRVKNLRYPLRGNPNIRAIRGHLASQKPTFLRRLKFEGQEMMNSTDFLLPNKSQKQSQKGQRQ